MEIIRNSEKLMMSSSYNILLFCKMQYNFYFFWILTNSKIKTCFHEISHSMVYFKILVMITGLCEVSSRIHFFSQVRCTCGSVVFTLCYLEV